MAKLDYARVMAYLEAYEVAEKDPARARTRGRILASAAALFARYGYRRTSVDEVAHEAGVAKGTVYLYFESKAELLLFVLLEEKRRHLAGFREILDGYLSPDERLRRYLERTLIAVAESPLSRRLLLGDREIVAFMAELPKELRARMTGDRLEALHSLLAGVGAFDDLTPEEREARVRILLAILETFGHLIEARASSGLDLPRYARLVAKVLVGGIGAP